MILKHEYNAKITSSKSNLFSCILIYVMPNGFEMHTPMYILGQNSQKYPAFLQCRMYPCLLASTWQTQDLISANKTEVKSYQYIIQACISYVVLTFASNVSVNRMLVDLKSL